MCWNTLLVSTGATATVFLLEEQQVRVKMEMNYVKLCPVPAMGSPCLHPTRNEGFWSGGFKRLGWKGKQTGPACIGGQITKDFVVRRPELQTLSVCKGCISIFPSSCVTSIAAYVWKHTCWSKSYHSYACSPLLGQYEPILQQHGVTLSPVPTKIVSTYY